MTPIKYAKSAALLVESLPNSRGIVLGYVLVLVGLFVGPYAFGAQDIKARIVGEWQQGLTDDNKQDPIIESTSLGFLGPIVNFRDDGTFSYYFPCNLDIPLKLKTVIARGQWEVQANRLRMTLTERGDARGPLEQVTEVSISEVTGRISVLAYDGFRGGKFSRAVARCGRSTEYLKAR